MSEVKRTERGWCGHLIVGNWCRFRRNTLLEKGRKKIVVSTVGNYWTKHEGKSDTIGLNRYYETMVFRARFEKPYWEANVSKEISFDSEWAIGEIAEETDLKANSMHEAVVEEIEAKLRSGEL